MSEVKTLTKKIDGPQAVMQSPAQLREQMQSDTEIRQIITEYIKNAMVEGKDYGTITIKGAKSKPSLFKPGAEKFCGLFKIRPTFKKDTETVEMLGNTPGIIAYICELVDSRGIVIGEGRGTAKTDPKGGSDFDINKQVKIAQKRAQIDAVLRTGGLSDFFTQDMEDAPKEVRRESNEYPLSDRQRKWIVDEVARVIGDQDPAANYQYVAHEDDIKAFLEDYVGVELDKIPGRDTKKTVDKIREISLGTAKESAKQLDEVVEVDIDKPFNIDDIPF